LKTLCVVKKNAKRETGIVGETSVNLHIPLRREGHFDQQKAPQDNSMQQLERHQQRRATHHQRNREAIQKAQLRDVAAPQSLPAANNRNVVVVDLEPPPSVVVMKTVQLVLVPLMSAADKQQTAKEDAQYAKEEEKAAAAGVVMKPRPSPFSVRECCTCMTRPAIVTVVGCGHFCLCGPCAMQIQATKYAKCPKCRTGQHNKNGELFLQRLY
jgi:Zinc finger, C3HC4 type (RING finger)